MSKSVRSSKQPAITEAEWHVMRVLWERPDEWLPAAAIVEPVARERGVHHRTVRTLLARLVKKNAVETRRAGDNAFLYHVRVSLHSIAREESRSFLSRVFDNHVAPALVHLLHQNRDRLSPAEVQELRDLLDGKEKS